MSREMPYNSEQKNNDWRIYERIVAAFEAENADIEMSVTPNARIIGCISGQERQIDVLIDARWDDDISKRIIVDAKLHRTKLDIKDVESFEGMMRDCRAQRGILVCPNGWTKGAERRAQDAITMKLLALEEIDDSASWACFDECRGECFTTPKARSEVGLVLWDAQHLLGIESLWAIVYTGKCDVCHNFHIWCWDCGEKIALPDEREYECPCERLWVSAIEEEIDDSNDTRLTAIHLFLCTGEYSLPLDRRRLR